MTRERFGLLLLFAIGCGDAEPDPPEPEYELCSDEPACRANETLTVGGCCYCGAEDVRCEAWEICVPSTDDPESFRCEARLCELVVCDDGLTCDVTDGRCK